MLIKKLLVSLLIIGNLLFIAPEVFAHRRYVGYTYTSVNTTVPYTTYTTPVFNQYDPYYVNYVSESSYYDPYSYERSRRVRRAIKYGAIGAALGYFLGR